MADILPFPNAGGDVAAEENPSDFYNGPNNYGNNPASNSMYNNPQGPPRPRYPGLYVGNLTWWTTDRDVIDAINSIGVDDVQEVKFFENRNNGQSKGFCAVTFTSDASLPIVMEKLPTKDLHGQNPVVSPYNRANLQVFENLNKSRQPISATNGPTSHGSGIMGINSITGVHVAAAANAQVAAASAVANIPYANVAPAVGAANAVGLGYNQGALGMNSMAGPNPRPLFHTNMRMRGPRPSFRPMMGSMNNGAMMTGGHLMMRPRFMSQQTWNNNNQGGYNSSGGRVGPQMNADIANRLSSSGGSGGGMAKQDDSGSDMMGSSSYYNSHHSNSQSDHYRSDIRDHKDHRELRDDRDVRRLDDRPSRLDDRSLRQDDRIRDDRSSKQDDRLDRLRRDDRSSRKIEDDRSSRRSDDRREDRSSRREDKSSSSSSRHHRERSHRSDERPRSRSRSKDRSRDGKSEGRRDRDRERDRERERDRRERY